MTAWTAKPKLHEPEAWRYHAIAKEANVTIEDSARVGRFKRFFPKGAVPKLSNPPFEVLFVSSAKSPNQFCGCLKGGIQEHILLSSTVLRQTDMGGPTNGGPSNWYISSWCSSLMPSRSLSLLERVLHFLQRMFGKAFLWLAGFMLVDLLLVSFGIFWYLLVAQAMFKRGGLV